MSLFDVGGGGGHLFMLLISDPGQLVIYSRRGGVWMGMGYYLRISGMSVVEKLRYLIIYKTLTSLGQTRNSIVGPQHVFYVKYIALSIYCILPMPSALESTVVNISSS